MINNNEEKAPIRPVLRKLEVGDTATYPLYRRGAVLSCFYSIELQYDRKFTSKADRENKLFHVTRIK